MGLTAPTGLQVFKCRVGVPVPKSTWQAPRTLTVGRSWLRALGSALCQPLAGGAAEQGAAQTPNCQFVQGQGRRHSPQTRCQCRKRGASSEEGLNREDRVLGQVAPPGRGTPRVPCTDLHRWQPGKRQGNQPVDASGASPVWGWGLDQYGSVETEYSPRSFPAGQASGLRRGKTGRTRSFKGPPLVLCLPSTVNRGLHEEFPSAKPPYRRTRRTTAGAR